MIRTVSLAIGVAYLCMANLGLRAQEAPAFSSASIPEVRTDSFHVIFAAQGAFPLEWDIVDPRCLNSETASDDPGQARISLIRHEANALGGNIPLAVLMPGSEALASFYNSAKYEWESLSIDDRVGLRFTSPPGESGLRLQKTYLFPQSGFACSLRIELLSSSGTETSAMPLPRNLGLSLGGGFGQTPSGTGGLANSLYNYTRPVVFAGGEATSPKLNAKTPEAPLGSEAEGIGWAGVHSRYFVFAAVPSDAGGSIQAAVARLADANTPNAPVVDVLFSASETQDGALVGFETGLFAGPKIPEILTTSPGSLETVLFYNLWDWLRYLCFGLLKVLELLHSVLRNWGLAIIGLAVVVRVATFPIVQSGLKAQEKFNRDQARLKPLVEAIREQFKSDPAAQHRETMKLYKDEGVNPYAAFKGCAWVLIQIPIFIALFNLIGQAYSLRGAGFLWINDLSDTDRLFDLGFSIPLLGSSFNLLPFIMAASQVVTVHLPSANQVSAEEAAKQRRTVLFMAAAFFVLFYSFPSGLVLYWTTSNLLHFAQHRLVRAKHEAGPDAESKSEN